MNRTRVPLAALAAASLALLPGCLTLFSKTEVIRGEEQPRAVVFENPQAAEQFHRARKNRPESVGGTHLGLPFVTFYSRDRKLSENAHFNDCVARCDTDQNAVITYDEAVIFAKHMD